MDDKFKKVLLRKYPHLFDNNSEIIISECEKMVTMSLYYENLTSIEGVEVFTNLQHLYCNLNQLTSLNVQGLENLKNLDCANNQLTSLDVQGLTNLQNLNCDNNQLTSLDVQGLTKLQQFRCDSNVKIDVPFVFNTSRYCAFQAVDGYIRCGCFKGSKEEFIEAVLEKYDKKSPYYTWAIAL